MLHGTGSSGAPSSEMRRLQGASFTTYTDRYSGSPLRGALIRALYVAGSSWRAVVLTLAGRRERAAATRAVIRGVVTHRAFVGRHRGGPRAGRRRPARRLAAPPFGGLGGPGAGWAEGEPLLGDRPSALLGELSDRPSV